MTGRIVVFGATGYTGGLVARSLVARGARPVLAARSQARLDDVAGTLGGLETVVADVHDPASVAALVGKGDVLVSTVGPFSKWGDPALQAAVGAGAHYLDTTGEPAFIRRVFDHYGSRAEASGSTLVTAFGFDWVPGNVAGALAMEAAGPDAVTLHVGYYLVSVGASGGTAASAAGAILDKSFTYRDGRLKTERTAARVRRFDLGDERNGMGLSVGGTEHFDLPLLYPQLREVDVILGRDSATRALPYITGAVAGIARIPGVGKALRGFLEGRTEGSTGGPGDDLLDTGSCTVIAEARSASGELLHRVRLDGPSTYGFTGDIVAWGAVTAAEGGLSGPGALGPVSAYGLEALTAGTAAAGIVER